MKRPVWALVLAVLLIAGLAILVFKAIESDRWRVEPPHQSVAKVNRESPGESEAAPESEHGAVGASAEGKGVAKAQDGELISRAEVPPSVAGIHARILDEAASPLAGAQLLAIRLEHVDFPPPQNLQVGSLLANHVGFAGTANEDGALRIEIDASTHLLIARMEGHYAEATWWIPEDDVTNVRFVLRPSPGVFGRVIDRYTRMPVEGARLLAIPREPVRAIEAEVDQDLSRFMLARETVTAADGTFLLGDVRSEQHDLFCFAPPYPDVRTSGLAGNEPHIIRVSGIGTATGIVVNEDDEPVVGIGVGCTTRGENPPIRVASAVTDEEGMFFFEDIPMGPVSIWAHSEDSGYATQKVFLDLTPDQADVFLELRVSPEAEFRGVVVDAQSNPIQGALVEVWDQTLNAMTGQMETEPDGSWYMKWVNRDSTLTVMASKEGYGTTSLPGLSPTSDAVEVVLHQDGALVGIVQDESGAPVQSFSVSWIQADAQHSTEELFLFAEGWQMWKNVEDDSGRFEFPSVWGPAVDVLVQAPDYEPVHVSKVSIPPGSSTEGLIVRLRRGVSIHGRVMSHAGQPVDGASVRLARSSQSGLLVGSSLPLDVVTSAGGRFELSGIPSCFSLAVSVGTTSTYFYRDLCPQDFPRDLVMGEPGSLAGVVQVRWPAPESTVSVRISPVETWSDLSLSPDGEGKFFVEGLAPGPYRVEVVDTWTTFETASDSHIIRFVTIEPGATTSVEISSADRGQVVGSVRTEGSRSTPLDRFTVSLFPVSQSGELAVEPMAMARSDGAGSYMIVGVPAGSYSVVLAMDRPGQALQVEKPVVVPDHGTARTDFVVSTEAVVRGEVLDPTGGAADAMVWMFRSHGPSAGSTRTNRDGAYSFYQTRV